MNELMKICSKCDDEKSIDEFNKSKANKNGIRSECKKCQSKYQKKYQKNNTKAKESRRRWKENNPKYNKEYYKKYYKKNRNKLCKEYRIYYQDNKEKIIKRNKKWQEVNPDYMREYLNEYQKKKRGNNFAYKLNGRISNLIRYSLKNRKNGIHWETLVGYTLNDLMKHLENLFLPSMTWDNYGKDGWSIDHIRPVSIFNITSNKCKGFKKCWGLENLRPMWAKDNLKKSNKLFQ